MSEITEGGFEEALAALSSLINQRKRADGSNWGDAFALMYKYVEVRDMGGRKNTFTNSVKTTITVVIRRGPRESCEVFLLVKECECRQCV